MSEESQRGSPMEDGADKALRLIELLEEARLSRTSPSPAWAKWAQDLGVASRHHLEKVCADVFQISEWLPLVERDLLTSFDTEGDFYRSGVHSELVEYLLRPVSLPPIEIFEQWLPTTGRILSVKLGGETHHCFQPSPLERPSDYAQVSLLVESTTEVLLNVGSELRPYTLSTGGQNVAIALLPKRAVSTIQTEGLLSFHEELDEDGDLWMDEARPITEDEVTALLASGGHSLP